MTASASSPARRVKPLSERKLDYLFVGFFLLNILFITPIVDIEQLVIDDPNDFEYPLWPPAAMVDLVHWWGRNFDPPLMAREAWWRATIWIDQIFFFPFYAAAIYAFIKGKEWIRNWCFVWGSVMMTNVFIICWEECFGAHATDSVGLVLFANFPWFTVPIVLMARMWNAPHPFTEEA
ncbi:MAG: emopamil-binding family protein [Myxococcota bacterium]